MYRGRPPNGQLMPIRNPYIGPAVEDIRATYCFDQISLINGPIFSIKLKDFEWKTLLPNSTSISSKSVKKFQKLMGNQVI